MIKLHHQPDTPAADAAQTPVLCRPRWQRAVARTMLAGALCLAGVAHDAVAVQVSLDTSTLLLFGTRARLEFVLYDADFAANNSARIASISTDGVLGAVDCSFGCTAVPPFTLDDALTFGEFLQDLTLGSSVLFELSFTSHYSGNGTSDRLVLSLLDPDTNFTLVDTDLDFAIAPVAFQDALLFVDLAGDGRIQVAGASNPSIPINIPEPGAGALFSFGLALVGGQRIRRRSSSVSRSEQAAAQDC